MEAFVRLFDLLLVLYALLVYSLLVWSVLNHRPILTGVAVWIASPLLLLVLRLTLERASDLPLIDLAHGSWSFQLGDTFILMPALVVCALAYRHLPQSGLFTSWKWILGCFAVGLLLGMAFHWMEVGNYTRAGVELALNSPTKRAHDFVAYPVLAGALIAVGVPVVKQWNGYSWTFLVLVVIHFILMGADTFRAVKGILIHSRLHPLVDAVTMHVIKL